MVAEIINGPQTPGIVPVDENGFVDLSRARATGHRYREYERLQGEYEDYVHMRNAAWFRSYIDSLSPEQLERLLRCGSRRRQEGKVDWKKEGF